MEKMCGRNDETNLNKKKYFEELKAKINK